MNLSGLYSTDVLLVALLLNKALIFNSAELLYFFSSRIVEL